MAKKPKARVIEITNPFLPLKDSRTTVVPRPMKVRTWLRHRHGKRWKKFSKPTIIIFNGDPILQKDWDRVIRRGDVVNIVQLTGAPVVALWVIAVAAVVGVVVALNIKIKAPNQGQQPEADAVYTLKGQRNQIRLGMPIETAYGRVRMWPSYAAQPYNEYNNNDQWLYQLFCLGQGEYNIEGVFIEDTPAGNFSDVEWEICPPGTAVTLFPDNVVTSAEVGNIELFGPNEGKTDGDETEDSPGNGLDPGDPDYIPPTTHVGYFTAGPFVANPANTLASKIQLDVSFPRGLYTQQNDGQLGNATVTALFEKRRINDAGAPISGWSTLYSFSKTLATATPQRFTLEEDVTSGRYEVRASRTNDKATDSKISDTLQWEAMRAFLPSVQDYGDVTMLAMKARASNNLNDNSASRINVVGTRCLETWDGSTWSARTPTRNLVWAYCDIMRANYGGRLSPTYLELSDLKDKADFFHARQDWFDWIFEQRITVWDALKLACLVGRSIPMPNGSRFGMVRDGPQTLRTGVFNQETIVKNSFRREIKLAQLDDYDGLEVTYTDPTTWKEETVLCCMPGETGDNPEKVTLSGCTNRTMAYRWGMWKRASTRYRREQVVFQTGTEGHIPSYGDLIGVVHDVPRWGQGGFVTSIAEDNQTLTLSEPVTFADGTNKIQLRKKNGSASDVYTVTAGVDAYHVVLTVPLDPADYAFTATKEPPIFTFGPESLYNKAVVITGLDPSDENIIEITATPYRDEPHSYDEAEPPDQGDTDGAVPGRPALPSVTGLICVKSPNVPNEIVATWNATRGARYYVIQLSYDNGVSWETLSSAVETTSYRFTVLPKYIWVRVCAVTTGAGPFSYWMGNAPTEDTNIIIDEGLVPNPVTGVVLTAGFGMVAINWIDPTNVPRKKLKAIHIYVTYGSAAGWDTQPVAPTYSIRPGQMFHSITGLADNTRVNLWLEVETLFEVFSTVSGPHSATTVNGITLDHLIPGGLQPVEILTVIPSTNNYKGRLVFLTATDAVGTDYLTGLGFVANKVYRWEGTGTPASPVSGKNFWTAAAPAVDITGNITDAQIAALAAAKLTGQITSTQITDGAISTPKLAAGAVETANLAADAVVASKIAAGAITAGKIAAGVVTATELAADSVVAGKIQAGAIVAAAIGTNEIIAHTANIKNGVITSAKIGDAEITTAKIATANVTTLLIAGNAVTVPISATAAGPIVVSANDTEDLVSCNSHEVIGSEPVFMIATFEVTALDNNTHFFRFLQDGSQISGAEWETKMPIIGKNTFSISWAVTPGAGTYNFGLQVYGKSDNSGAGDSFRKISMLTLSTRR